MSPEFQETLSDNLMHQASVDIQYGDYITLRHKDTKVYLHSHPDKYPLRYEDGRISSQGQQVTGYPFNDTNNQWQILPGTPNSDSTQEGQPVLNGDVVQLRHIVTDTMLLTHDVASPFYPTNQEFTTVALDLAAGDRHNDTLFEIRMEQGKQGQPFRSHSGQFKLIHFPTKVAMWTHTTPLPEWAFKQAEINGNKNVQQSSNIWYVDDIPSIPEDSPRLVKEPKKVKRLPFLTKYFELQRAMFYHNNALTSSHPYASQPYQWPFLLRGVSFWTQESTKQQIYFLGNPIGYWITSALLAVLAGIMGADQLSLRRGVDALDKRKFSSPHGRLMWLSADTDLSVGTRSRLYNSTGFFFLCWAAHYFPFYLMGRQLFLHHYLPAHLASCLVTGALVEFIFNVDPILDDETSSVIAAKKDKVVSKVPEKTRRSFQTAQERLKGQSMFATWVATAVVLAVVIYGFYFFFPLTYGWPGLNPQQVNARKWLGYDLHFAK